MSLLGIRWTAEPLRFVGFATIAGAAGNFAPCGAGLLNPACQLYLQNLTDVQLFVSFNGVTDHVVMPAGSALFFDIGSDRNETSGALVAPVGMVVSFAQEIGNPPTMGNAFVSAFFAAPQAS